MRGQYGTHHTIAGEPLAMGVAGAAATNNSGSMWFVAWLASLTFGVVLADHEFRRGFVEGTRNAKRAR